MIVQRNGQDGPHRPAMRRVEPPDDDRGGALNVIGILLWIHSLAREPTEGGE
jgi:hypothetical protein